MDFNEKEENNNNNHIINLKLLMIKNLMDDFNLYGLEQYSKFILKKYNNLIKSVYTFFLLLLKNKKFFKS